MSDKWKVCPDCEGDGNDKEAEIEFTANDVYEWYGDDVEAQEDFRRSYMRGDYSKPCQTCKGQRVIPAADYEDAIEEIKYRHEAEMLHRAESGWSY